MIKKIDWYIIRKFLGTFFFILSLLMAISVIFDISEKIDNFLRSEAPLKGIILDYYLNFIIYYGNLFSSLLVFISVILFTSKMSSQTEIVAILASGVSFNRFLRPFFISATVLVALSFAFTHYIVPQASKGMNDFKYTYIDYKERYITDDIHRETSPGIIVYAESVNAQEKILFNFSVERWKDGKLVYKLISDRATFDTTRNLWTINNYYQRFIGDSTERLDKGFQMDTVMNLKLEDFSGAAAFVNEMTSPVLGKFIEKETLRGSDKVPAYQVELYQRTSLPLATYILTLLGASIASRKVRGGIGLHIALGIFLAVIYIFFLKVSTVAATNAGMQPMVAVWLPNLCFAMISLYIYRKSPK